MMLAIKAPEVIKGRAIPSGGVSPGLAPTGRAIGSASFLITTANKEIGALN